MIRHLEKLRPGIFTIILMVDTKVTDSKGSRALIEALPIFPDKSRGERVVKRAFVRAGHPFRTRISATVPIGCHELRIRVDSPNREEIIAKVEGIEYCGPVVDVPVSIR